MAQDTQDYPVVDAADKVTALIEGELKRTGGVFRLAPCWVGRPGIIVPGRRIKLRDIYFSQTVAVNERWLASATYADNGTYNSVCPPDHGFSYLVIDGRRVMLRRAFEVCPEAMLGSKTRKWDVLPKFFDNWDRIPNHLHPCQDHVRKGLVGKPESYHFPLELNMNPNNNPATPFGCDTSYSDEQVLHYLSGYFKGDNRLTDLCNTINLIAGTGYYTPPCTMHAPGSLVTYELQAASDVSSIPESRVKDMVMPADMLDRDLPCTVDKDGAQAVFEYLLSMVRCPNSGNADNFRREYFRPPVTVRRDNDGSQDFVIYRTGKASEAANPDLYSAKHTVVSQGAAYGLGERAPFGAIVLGGHGVLQVPGKAPVPVETAGIFHTRTQMGGDEVFVAACAAKSVEAHCRSVEDLSLYQHFASGANPESGSLRVPDYVPFS